MLLTPLVLLIPVAPAAGAHAVPAQSGTQQHERDSYLGVWESRSTRVRFTLVLRPDGTGYLADEVERFPFSFTLHVDSVPARLDLSFGVDMAFGRRAHTLVRLEAAEDGPRLHWVSMHSEPGPPAWPPSESRTPAGVTWITFVRARH